LARISAKASRVPAAAYTSILKLLYRGFKKEKRCAEAFTGGADSDISGTFAQLRRFDACLSVNAEMGSLRSDLCSLTLRRRFQPLPVPLSAVSWMFGLISYEGFLKFCFDGFGLIFFDNRHYIEIYTSS
jgi:hypothetical protein